MKRILQIVPALLLICSLFFAQTAAAFTITFDEIAATQVGAAGVQIGHVTISYFGNPDYSANIGDLGPIVGNPLLLGDSIGLLLLDFAVPTTLLRFNFSLDAFKIVTTGVMAELFAPNGDLAATIGAAADFFNQVTQLPEGMLLYEGAAISQAFLLFDIVDSTSFTIDNIAYQPVPEPSTLLLLVAGLAGVGFLKKKYSLS